jgi:hypothetical protein
MFRPMSSLLRFVSAAVLVGLVAGSAGAGSRASPVGVTTCPNPGGGRCLGTLAAGTYRTTLFRPAIGYTVTDGWSNFEDTPGNFLLVPPWGSLPGVNAGTSDYVGIYMRVAAARSPGCAPGPSRTVGRSARAISTWIGRNRGLVVSRRASVSVGGLHGFVIDIQMRTSWKKTCPYSGGLPVVQLISGVSPSHLDHGIGPRPMKMRLYLLNFNRGALAIELVDLHGGNHLRLYSSLVKHVTFRR